MVRRVFFGYILLLFCLVVYPVQAMGDYPLESQVLTLSEKLVQSYLKNRNIIFKKTIAVIEFENIGQTAQDNHLGQSLTEIFSQIFSNASNFRVVERRDLKRVLKEQALQQTGITDQGGVVETGRIRNADLLLSGRVIEVGNGFQINAKLTDVSSGETISETVLVQKKDLLATREYVLDMAYVQRAGVGITLTGMGYTMSGNEVSWHPFFNEEQTGLRRNAGVEFRYRFTKNLMMGAGANWIYANTRFFPLLAYDNSGGTNFNSQGAFRIEGQGISLPIFLYGVINPWRRVNFFAFTGVEYFVLNFSGLFIPSNGKGFGINEIGPQLHGETLAYHAGGGVEFFLAPRLALSLRLSYMHGTLLLNAKNGSEHLDLSTSTRIDLSGFTYQPAVSFYF